MRGTELKIECADYASDSETELLESECFAYALFSFVSFVYAALANARFVRKRMEMKFSR